MKLKYSAALIAATALAITFGATAAGAKAARADTATHGGGPMKMGKMCWMSSGFGGASGLDNGYWSKCSKAGKAMKHHKKKAMKAAKKK
jgi:hypothetical protein